MEIVDTGYPMVLRPSKERIVASLKKMGHKFEPNEGIVDGGVYPWLSKQALESDNKTKRKLVVEEIRHKNEEDLKKLLKRHRTDYESTADKLDRFRKSMNLSKKTTFTTQPDESLNSFKVRISSTLLPLGYNHLKVPFGGKNLAQTLKTQESDTKTFDPVNSSLLVQDQEGLKLIKKLKKRVDKIQINRSNPEGSQKIKREVHFKHNNKLTDSIRKSMIKPIFIEKVAFKADQALRNIPEFTGIPLDLTNLNTDRIINNFRKRDSIFKKSNEHFLQLFQLSKLPPEVRDKHCQKEIPKEVLNFGGTTKRVSRSTSKVKESLRNLSPSQLKKEKDFQERGEIDPNRLPYLYLCPSI